MRVCTIPSAPFSVSNRSITSLTASSRHFSKPRAAFLPSYRRFIQNEAVQAERESETGDISISEEVLAETQGHENDLSSPASSQDPIHSSSTAEAVADGTANEASLAPGSAAAASESTPTGVESSGSVWGSESDSKPQQETPISNLYVGNLNFEMTEEEVAKVFATAGEVPKVQIVKDARNFSRGWVPHVIMRMLDYVMTDSICQILLCQISGS